MPNRLDKSVDCEPLVKQVQEAFAPFTAQQVKDICRLYRYPSPS